MDGGYTHFCVQGACDVVVMVGLDEDGRMNQIDDQQTAPRDS